MPRKKVNRKSVEMFRMAALATNSRSEAQQDSKRDYLFVFR